MPKLAPLNKTRSAMMEKASCIRFEVAALNLFFSHVVSCETAKSPGVVATPNVNMNSEPFQASAVAREPASAVYTNPHGNRPFSNPKAKR